MLRSGDGPSIVWTLGGIRVRNIDRLTYSLTAFSLNNLSRQRWQKTMEQHLGACFNMVFGYIDPGTGGLVMGGIGSWVWALAGAGAAFVVSVLVRFRKFIASRVSSCKKWFGAHCGRQSRQSPSQQP